MEGGKGREHRKWQSLLHRQACILSQLFVAFDRRAKKRILDRPDDVEDGGAEELVVDGRRHVAWFVKGRGYSAHGVAEVYTPQQEEELSWGTQSFRWNGFLFVYARIQWLYSKKQEKRGCVRLMLVWSSFSTSLVKLCQCSLFLVGKSVFILFSLFLKHVSLSLCSEGSFLNCFSVLLLVSTLFFSSLFLSGVSDFDLHLMNTAALKNLLCLHLPWQRSHLQMFSSSWLCIDSVGIFYQFFQQLIPHCGADYQQIWVRNKTLKK